MPAALSPPISSVTNLVIEAQAGSDYAKNKLAQRFNLAAIACSGPLLRYMSKDEAVSFAYRGLAKAIRAFDPSRGFQFSTYAITAMTMTVNTELRAQSRIGLQTQEIGDCDTLVSGNVSESAEAKAMAEAVIAFLSPIECRAVALLVRGQEHEEIAIALDIPKTKVSGFLKKTRGKAKIALYAKGLIGD